MLSRPIIYALFSQFFVGFWGLGPQTPTRAPFLDPAGGLSFLDPLICPPLEKNPAGAHGKTLLKLMILNCIFYIHVLHKVPV